LVARRPNFLPACLQRLEWMHVPLQVVTSGMFWSLCFFTWHLK
jgi:hypothetical protein